MADPHSIPQDEIDRFWQRVQKTEGCWTFTGYTGYGLYGSHGVTSKLAHRFAWVITNGPIPHGLGVLHRCDNPPCCNPDHLFLGTQRDNMIDASQKGRLARGEQRPSHKLTDSKVREIRELFARGAQNKALARRFGVGDTTVRRIVRRIIWKHV